jgi:hypothetical protein
VQVIIQRLTPAVPTTSERLNETNEDYVDRKQYHQTGPIGQ